jgi:hypothetical protein
MCIGDKYVYKITVGAPEEDTANATWYYNIQKELRKILCEFMNQIRRCQDMVVGCYEHDSVGFGNSFMTVSF